MELANGVPLVPRGVTTIPVTLIGVLNVRKSPVKGSFAIIPPGLELVRAGNVAKTRTPAVSTPVVIVKGCPDCASVNPAICQPPKILLNASGLDENHGIS